MTTEPDRRDMVEWYAPLQLLSTGIQVLISAAMGQRFDYRLMEDVAYRQEPFDDWTNDSEVWFDFLADTGDGWNSTFAIASLVAAERLTLDGTALPRGQILIMGGDIVYPYASQENYRKRFVGPFEAALGKVEEGPRPQLFVIPGNHDWYDGLVSFARRFTQGRGIGGWITRQERSYFALKLPYRWWLWAVDVHLESDIDYGQLRYFRRIAEDEMQPGDRVILVSAEPEWIYRGDSRDVRKAVEAGKLEELEKKAIEESNLKYLEEKVIKDIGRSTVYLWLAGDLHHYRRHEKDRDQNFQRITSGGGGAFLHPTHLPEKRELWVGRDRYERKSAYPTPRQSFLLSLGNLLFLFKNWTLGWLTGFAYLAMTWTWMPALQDWLAHPLRLFVVLLVMAGFVFFADQERRWQLGVAHGIVQLACAFLVSYGAWLAASRVGAWLNSLVGGIPWETLVYLCLNFAGGFVVVPIVLGLYLFVSLNVFGAHANEAFSSLRIQDYKHFLRLHITRDGHIKIYPIGVDDVHPPAGAPLAYKLIERIPTIVPR